MKSGKKLVIQLKNNNEKQSNKRDRIKGRITKNISLIKGLLQIYSNRGSTIKNYTPRRMARGLYL